MNNCTQGKKNIHCGDFFSKKMNKNLGKIPKEKREL